MTFVTKDKLGRDESESKESAGTRARQEIQLYSGESVSASNAFRLEIVTVRPSI
jgi:hypothetical protein